MFPREVSMAGGLRLPTRRALLQQMIPQYREASSVKKKSKLLDAFTATTGYNRKYAMWLLNHAQEGQHLAPADVMIEIRLLRDHNEKKACFFCLPAYNHPQLSVGEQKQKE